MIAHHTLGGCDLRPGDLLGTGTISSPVGHLSKALHLNVLHPVLYFTQLRPRFGRHSYDSEAHYKSQTACQDAAKATLNISTKDERGTEGLE